MKPAKTGSMGELLLPGTSLDQALNPEHLMYTSDSIKTSEISLGDYSPDSTAGFTGVIQTLNK